MKIIKNINWDFLNKKELKESIILYTTTLVITLGLIYLLFPNLLSGMYEVRKINKNIVIINEKIDTIKTTQDILLEKVDILNENQYNSTQTILDTLRLLNQKIEDVQHSTFQNNRIANQNIIELQKIKRLQYELKINDNSMEPPKVSALEGLFKKGG
jgi:hypothetical protein